MNKTHFGQRLAKLRKLKGLSQEELAKKAKLTRRTIAYYELEEKIDFVNKIERLAQALEIPITELFNYSNGDKQKAEFEILNPRVVKKLQKLLQLKPADRTKIYEQIELFLSKDEYKNNK